jgi:RNA polymerase sigma factor (sigma-70 family)
VVEAARRYDPQRGPFGPYAKLWCKGEVKALFKPGKDAIGFGRFDSLNVPAFADDDEAKTEEIDLISDEITLSPVLNLDDLSEKERHVVRGHTEGKTLLEIGGELDLSAERIRQITVRAVTKLHGASEAPVVFCVDRSVGSRQEMRFRDREAKRFRYEYLGYRKFGIDFG